MQTFLLLFTLRDIVHSKLSTPIGLQLDQAAMK